MPRHQQIVRQIVRHYVPDAVRRVLVTLIAAAIGAAGLNVFGALPAAAGSLRTCPTACVSIADTTIVEGDTGTRSMSFAVTLSQPSTSQFTVAYRVQNVNATAGATQVAGIDYNDARGVLRTLTFKPALATGLTPVSKTVTVTVYGDTVVEPTEAVRVTLSALTGTARLRRPVAVGTILDDDAGAGVRASVGDASVVEGDSAKTRNLTFRVTLSSPATSEVVLTYVVTPGAATYSLKSTTPGGDFGGKLTNTIKFPVSLVSGKTPVLKTISIPVWAETTLESDESIVVTLSAASLPAGVTLERTVGNGTIVDDDAPATTVPVPNSMASLGDSISRAFNACATFGECPAAVWSTGDAGVNSHYSRILAINPAIAGHSFNDAVSGAVMANLNGQAVNAVSQNVEYVTIEMGGNDACKPTEGQMTPSLTYLAQFQQAMTTLTNGLPNARILVASVPDIHQLWVVGKDSATARSVWSAFGICQSMVANPLSTDPADVDRRARVRQRVVDFNTALALVCLQYPNCRFDQNAVFNSPFALSDVSPADFFHPSYAGQTGLAASSYAAGFDW